MGLYRELEKGGAGFFLADEAYTWLSWPCWRPEITKRAARSPTVQRLAMKAALQFFDEHHILRVFAMPPSRVVRKSLVRSNLALNVERRPSLISWTSESSPMRHIEAESTFRQRRAFLLFARLPREVTETPSSTCTSERMWNTQFQFFIS